MLTSQTIIIGLATTLLLSCHGGDTQADRAGVEASTKQDKASLGLSATPMEDYANELWLTSDEGLCSDTFPSLKPENIRAGVTLAGVVGTAVIDYPACSQTLKTNCITSASFPAVVTAGLAEKVATGLTLAGVTGTAAVETSSPCAADGQTSCLTTSDYPAAVRSGLAAKVVSGHTVAGVAGTAVEQRPDCSADGQLGCATTGTYPAAQTTGLAAKVISGNTVAGIVGTAIEETNPDCTGGNQTGCVTTSTYKSIDLSNAGSGGALDLTC